MIVFKSVRLHLFVILDYLVNCIKQQKPEDTVSWEFQLAWHSDLIQLACPCDGKNSKSQWLCQSWVVRRGKASSLNNYCTLYFSMHFHLNQMYFSMHFSFVQCHSLETCLLLSDPRLVIQVLNPCISAGTKSLGSGVGQCCRAGLWQMHTLFPAFHSPLRSLGLVNFLLVSAQLT